MALENQANVLKMATGLRYYDSRETRHYHKLEALHVVIITFHGVSTFQLIFTFQFSVSRQSNVSAFHSTLTFQL